ncbi:hypothetical protein CHUAL_000518 [Chamberlinius hualienensis]
MLKVLHSVHHLSVCTRNVKSLNCVFVRNLLNDNHADEYLHSRPKRPLTVFMRFVKDKVNEILNENPGIATKEATTLLGKQWRNYPLESKHVYEHAYLKEISEYKIKEETWWNSLTDEQKEIVKLKKKERKSLDQHRHKRKELKALGKPKQNRSSWTFFVEEKLKNIHFPEMSISYADKFAATLRKLRDEWKTMSEQDKERYVIMSVRDKERYSCEMHEWRIKMLKEGHILDVHKSKKMKFCKDITTQEYHFIRFRVFSKLFVLALSRHLYNVVIMASVLHRIVSLNTNKTIITRLITPSINVSHSYASLSKNAIIKDPASLVSDLPSPPVAPTPPYAVFIVEKGHEIRTKNPGITFSEVAKKNQEAWRKLSEIEKKVYLNDYATKRETYELQKVQWWNGLNESQKSRYKLHQKYLKEQKNRNELKRDLKDLDKPKKPLSAYIFFVTKFPKTRDIINQKEWIQKAAIAWKNLTETEKQVYDNMAKDDAKRYERELNEWLKSKK